MSQTQRTETSYYLQEKKVITIPLVAASEKGTAQIPKYREVAGPKIYFAEFIVKFCWKAKSKKVITL